MHYISLKALKNPTLLEYGLLFIQLKYYKDLKMTPASNILSLLNPTATKDKKIKSVLKATEELSNEINQHTFFLKLLETIKNDAKAIKISVPEILSKDEKVSSKPNLQYKTQDKINELKENILVAKEKITIKKEQKETKRLSDIIALAKEKDLNPTKIEIKKATKQNKEEIKATIEPTKEHKIADELKNQSTQLQQEDTLKIPKDMEVLKNQEFLKEPQILKPLKSNKELNKEVIVNQKNTSLKELLNLDQTDQKIETKSILKSQNQLKPQNELKIVEPIKNVKSENFSKIEPPEQNIKTNRQKDEAKEPKNKHLIKEENKKESLDKTLETNQKESPKITQKSKTRSNTQEITNSITQKDEPKQKEIAKKIDDKLQNQEIKPKKSIETITQKSQKSDIKTQENNKSKEQLTPKELESKIESKIELQEKEIKKPQELEQKEPIKITIKEKKETNSPKNEHKIKEQPKEQPKKVKVKNNHDQEKNLEPTQIMDETQKKEPISTTEIPKKQIEQQTKELKEIATVSTQSINTIQIIKKTQIKIHQTKIENIRESTTLAINQELKLKNKEIISQIATTKLESDEKKIKQKEKPKEINLTSLFQKLETEKVEKGLDKKIEQTEAVSMLQGQKINSENLELLYKSAMAKETLKNVANELKERIDNYKPPVTKLSLELHPLELGKVDVTITTRGNNIVVQLTSNQVAINLFAQNQTEFRANLMALGFSDVSMQFSFNNHQNNQERNQRNANRLYKESLEMELIESDILEISIPRYI